MTALELAKKIAAAYPQGEDDFAGPELNMMMLPEGEYSCTGCRAVGEGMWPGCNCTWCAECRAMVKIVDQGASPGFGAGYVYWADLACGHQLVNDCTYAEV